MDVLLLGYVSSEDLKTPKCTKVINENTIVAKEKPTAHLINISISILPDLKTKPPINREHNEIINFKKSNIGSMLSLVTFKANSFDIILVL